MIETSFEWQDDSDILTLILSDNNNNDNNKWQKGGEIKCYK